jgi:hypothetical protein
MSKQNNVNPDYYKVAGRERPGKTNSFTAKARSTEADERARWSERKNSEVRGKAEETEPEEEAREEQPPKQEPEA